MNVYRLHSKQQSKLTQRPTQTPVPEWEDQCWAEEIHATPNTVIKAPITICAMANPRKEVALYTMTTIEMATKWKWQGSKIMTSYQMYRVFWSSTYPKQARFINLGHIIWITRTSRAKLHYLSNQRNKCQWIELLVSFILYIQFLLCLKWRTVSLPPLPPSLWKSHLVNVILEHFVEY